MIEDIPEEDRASKINLERNKFPTAKTLGVLLTSNDDTFFFSCSPPVGNFKITKGNVLKKTASVYDPLGLISPYIIRAKVLMQQAWIEAIGWDESFPDPLREDWREWFTELSELEQIRIPRCLKDNNVVDSTIHTFTDASEKAYADNQ